MPKQNDLPSPVTYSQKFYAKAAGMDIDLPEAITPEQKYLQAIAEGGGGSGDAYTKAETDALLADKADLSILTPMTQAQYDAIVTKTAPLYFIYEDGEDT